MKTPQQVKQAYILNEEKKASEVYDRLRNSIEDGLERRYGEGNIMLFEHFPEDVVTTVFNEFSVYGWTMEYVLEGTEYYIGEKLLFDKIYFWPNALVQVKPSDNSLDKPENNK